MKKYAEYKGFIPKRYFDKQKKIEKKSIERGLLYFLAINIILIPINIEFFTMKKKVNQIENTVVFIEKNKQEEIDKWLNLKLEGLKNIKIVDNVGYMELEKKEDMYFIEEQGFKVKRIESKEGVVMVEVVSKD